MDTRSVKVPTRIRKGKRQIFYMGVWCDVPHGYKPGDEVNAKHKAMMKKVNAAKDVLDDYDPAPRWFDLKDLKGGLDQVWMDEWADMIAKKVDDHILKALTSGLLGRVDGFRIHKSQAVPLDRKQK